MQVTVIGEYGYKQALLGVGLSHGLTSGCILSELIADSELLERLHGIALKLALRGGSHAKFLESIAVWLDVVAPRYWWQQESTYRCGISRQSESTMHTIMERPLTHDDFVDIPIASLEAINWHIENSDFELVKALLPEGFLQRRIVCTNYKTLRHIVGQRYSHRLEEWRQFCLELLGQLEHADFLVMKGG